MKKITCSLIILVLCILNLNCANAEVNASSVFYKWGTEENPEFVYDDLTFISCFTPEEIVYMLFTNLFENKPFEAESFVPEGTRLLFARFSKGSLAINVSEEIRNYGGSYYERHLIYQIAETAFSLDGVWSITLYIEGGLGELPEGSVINNLDREQYQEMFFEK